MSPFAALASPAAQHLTWTLLHFLWQGALIALLTGLLLSVFAGRSSRCRYAIALLGLMAQSIAPLATYGWLAGIQDSGLASVAVRESAGVTLAAGAAPGVRAGQHRTGIDASPAAARWHGSWWSLPRWQPCVLGLWVCGVTLFSLRLVLSAVYGQWMRRGTAAVEPQLAARFAAIAVRLGLTGRQMVFVSPRVREALVVGFWRPLVILPASWLVELPPEILEAVVAHELSHIRRWDLWINLWQRLVETLLFYHPAVWWLSRRVRLEREMCCDELAVWVTGERVVYANALRTAACRRVAVVRPALATAWKGESRMSLLHRVRNVLGMGPVQPRLSWWHVALLAALIPLGACLAATFFNSGQTLVLADDDRRERDRPRDDQPPPRRLLRDADRPPQFDRPRDGERPRDDDRPRDGDVPRPAREGERDVPRQRDPNLREREGERRGPFDGPRRPPLDVQREELMLRLIQELKAEVAGLRQELRELRARQAPPPRGGWIYREREEAERARERAEGARERAEAQRARVEAEAQRHRVEDERARNAAEAERQRVEDQLRRYPDRERDPVRSPEAERQRDPRRDPVRNPEAERRPDSYRDPAPGEQADPRRDRDRRGDDRPEARRESRLEDPNPNPPVQISSVSEDDRYVEVVLANHDAVRHGTRVYISTNRDELLAEGLVRKVSPEGVLVEITRRFGDSPIRRGDLAQVVLGEKVPAETDDGRERPESQLEGPERSKSDDGE